MFAAFETYKPRSYQNGVNDGLEFLLSKVRKVLDINEEEALLALRDIDDGAQILSIRYWLFLTASSGIATLGVMLASPAILIGGMMLSPLLRPVTGISAGFAIGDVYLSIKSILNLIIGCLLTIITSALLSWISSVREINPELLSRISPNISYFLICIFCGLLSFIASIRTTKDNYKVGVGTILGITLLAPLCMLGFGLGVGMRSDILQGALLTFLTNISVVVVTGAICFYAVFKKCDIPSVIHLLSSRRSKDEQLYQFLSSFKLWQRLESQFSLENRVVFPSLLILLFSYPIFSSIFLLKQKAEVRSFLESKLAQLGDLSFVRGSETLVFTRANVSGTLVFYSRKPPIGLTKSLNEELTANFPDIRFGINLVRVQRESDTHQTRLSDLMENEFFDRSRHESNAKEIQNIVNNARDIVSKRFPEEAGYPIDINLQIRSEGIQSIVIEYVGQPLSSETEKMLASSLAKEFDPIAGNLDKIGLRRVGGIRGSIGCGSSMVSKGEIRREFVSVLEKISAHPTLGIEVYFGNPPDGAPSEDDPKNWETWIKPWEQAKVSLSASDSENCKFKWHYKQL
ncbi:PF04087 domain protein [Leptospira broomii serovar Hurstbridge str. 5399]|uniref:PF04087 domain protein n=2 Tax=Leptospira broomii TaxID=301541 RepID=T0F3H7_9LEPT|nr:PF04087 domain protein [Leptospira broomii serovar Hurstbridge str. 5399]